MNNLLLAWDEFKKGKRNKIDVQNFELYLEDNLFNLHNDLIDKKYKHNKYTDFYINDPKKRHIHKALVKDRLIHHAIHRIIYPIFDPIFIFDSYSSRKNKGVHKAISRLKVFLNKVNQTHNKCFVLKCDIKKFFSSIDHNILIKIISEKIKDEELVCLLKEIINSFESEFSINKDKKGLPIGNLTSQLFANVYLNELDQFIKQNLKIKYYIRYADDFVIIHQDKNYLINNLIKIDNFIKEKLKMSLHPNKISIRKCSQGVDYLGYVILPKATVLRTKTKRRILKKIKLRIKEYKNKKIDKFFLTQSINSYLGVLSHANSYKLKQKLKQSIKESFDEK